MENDLHRKRENLCLYFLMISSIRAHVSLWFYCALDGRCFSLLFLFFFLNCVASSHRRTKNEEKNIIGACIAPDIFMDLQHPRSVLPISTIYYQIHRLLTFICSFSIRFRFRFGFSASDAPSKFYCPKAKVFSCRPVNLVVWVL